MHAFDILGDPVRRRILELLAEGEYASGEVVAVISKEFGITQSAVSQHLKVLRDGGFATVRAEGISRLLVIGHREFRALMDEFPTVRHAVFDALAERLRQNEGL